jgi:DHA2 family metal-tetracycline-proton antiporter-like MFS transporter/DHA2 family florfenicol/chloramphenicol resistance protein-like MFS transporter
MSTKDMTVERHVDAPAQLFLGVVLAAVFITALTASMVNVILPVMRAEFAAPTAQVGWVITGYSLAYAIGVVLYGRISDLYGVRRVFVAGALGFAAGGFVCSLAPSLALLVLGRIIQGIGGAAVPSLATVAVAKVLPPGKRGGAMGLIASSVGIGSAVGPLVGGVLGQIAGWRLLFAGSLGLMLLLIPFARRVLPTNGTPGERRVDLLGGLLLGLSAGLFLFGITQGHAAGFGASRTWASFLGATLAAVGFIWWTNRTPDPFVPPALFRNRPYTAALLAGAATMFAYIMALVFVPLLVMETNRLPSSMAGLVVTPGAVALALVSPLAGRVSDRTGARLPVVGGIVIMGAAFVFISVFAGASPWLIAVGTAGVGTGFALIQSPVSNAAANALPAEAVGGGMGLFAGAFFLGGGTAPALIGAFLSARQEAGPNPLNPLYRLNAPAFSDAFWVTTLALVAAVILAIGLRDGTESIHERPAR